MRRVEALALLSVLLAASVVLPATACCTQHAHACCTDSYCPIPGRHAPHEQNATEHAGHHSSLPANACQLQASCNQTLRAFVAPVLPPTMMPAEVAQPVLQILGRAVPAASRHPLLGFDSLPLKPPRG